MGNFEKLVILTVLFLVATIFGISTQSDVVKTTEPLGTNVGELATEASSDGAGKLLSGLVTPGVEDAGFTKLGPKDPAPEKPAVKADEANKSAGNDQKTAGADKLSPGANQPLPTPDAAGRKSILISMEGLTASPYGDDYMLKVLSQGETPTVLANRYYGDRTRKSMIRSDNEGKSFEAGTKIMLARYDFSAEAGQREKLLPAPKHVAPPAKDTAVAKTKKASSYTVIEGDSLWKISQAVYGKGGLWGEIFKANRDQMSNENDLKLGMVLRIPAL